VHISHTVPIPLERLVHHVPVSQNRKHRLVKVISRLSASTLVLCLGATQSEALYQ
jgi:hypothetical protein